MEQIVMLVGALVGLFMLYYARRQTIASERATSSSNNLASPVEGSAEKSRIEFSLFEYPISETTIVVLPFAEAQSFVFPLGLEVSNKGTVTVDKVEVNILADRSFFGNGAFDVTLGKADTSSGASRHLDEIPYSRDVKVTYRFPRLPEDVGMKIDDFAFVRDKSKMMIPLSAKSSDGKQSLYNIELILGRKIAIKAFARNAPGIKSETTFVFISDVGEKIELVGRQFLERDEERKSVTVVRFRKFTVEEAYQRILAKMKEERLNNHDYSLMFSEAKDSASSDATDDEIHEQVQRQLDETLQVAGDPEAISYRRSST